ncbi:MAG: hypothetical protein RLZZ66_1045 [Pseudomonadota bacterium]
MNQNGVNVRIAFLKACTNDCLTLNHKWIYRHFGLYPIIYKIIIMTEETIQNDEKAENAILEAVRALTEMGVQLNEVTVPMKASYFLQQAGEAHDDARDRIQAQMNRMIMRGRFNIE